MDILTYPSNVLPDSLQFGDRTIRLVRREPAIGAQLWVAVAFIDPPTVGDIDAVLGYGATEYDAHRDVFERAKDQIAKNV